MYYSFDAKVCMHPIASTMCKDPLQKHAEQEAKHPTLCFSALKQYHAPKYMTDSNLEDDDDSENYGNGGEEAEVEDSGWFECPNPLDVMALVNALGEINPESSILHTVLEDGSPGVNLTAAPQIMEDSAPSVQPVVMGTSSKELPPFWLD